jgi:ABC-type oligopeptide transport system substrate-binding subunit
MKMKKNKFIAILMAVVMMMSCVTGCGKGGSSTGKEEAKHKDTLTVAKSEDITSLDPALAMNQKSFTIFLQIYEGLVK